MKVIKRTIVLLLVCFVSGSVLGYDKRDLEQFLKTNKCPSCDLRGADLSNRSLRGAALYYADLGNVNFHGSDLEGADLRSTNLEGARFSKSNLKDVRFIMQRSGWGVKPNVFQRRDLKKLDFREAIWINGKVCGEESVGKCVY